MAAADVAVIAFTALWYGTSVLAITTSKMAMQLAPVPFCLCFAQALVATAISGVTRQVLGVGASPGGETSLLWKVSLPYTLGFIFTNLAFSLAAAPFVETVKSSEPLSTVLLAYLLLGEIDSAATYAMLVPIVVGVAMASMGDMSGSALAFLVVSASNMGFSARAVYAKQLQKRFPNSPSARSDVEMFYHVSRLGLLVLLPTLLLDRSPFQAALASPDFDPVRLLGTMLFNGVFYTLYNLFSFVVLSRVSTSTHAVLNVFRRVVVIAVTTVFFGTPTTLLNHVGVATAVLGVLGFNRAKASAAAKLK